MPRFGRGRSPVFSSEPTAPIRRGLELVKALGGLEEGDAVTEKFFFGELDGGDDLGGNENGDLADDVRDSDFDEGAFVVGLFAFEAQAAARHILAGDDVVSALGMADESGVVDLGAGVLAALFAWSIGFLEGGQRQGENRGARFVVSSGLRARWRLQPGLNRRGRWGRIAG